MKIISKEIVEHVDYIVLDDGTELELYDLLNLLNAFLDRDTYASNIVINDERVADALVKRKVCYEHMRGYDKDKGFDKFYREITEFYYKQEDEVYDKSI